MLSRRHGLAMLFAATAMGLSGCTVDALYHGDLPFPFWLPVPVPQVIGDNIEEHLVNDYDEVPILPPIRDYAPVFCMDPPTKYDVIQAMPKPSRGGKIPFFYEIQYNDIEIAITKLVDSIDDCRFYPLIGPAQLHHCHYKCTVYFRKKQQSVYPFSWYIEEPDVDVVYIDRDHFHICTTPEMEAIPESYQDIYGPY